MTALTPDLPGEATSDEVTWVAVQTYASRGWACIPTNEAEKTPRCAHGHLDGTTDLGQLGEWFDPSRAGYLPRSGLGS
jgi:hypothetical protein